jgi:hypothetical protein
VTWCAQREPTLHAYSAEDLGKDMTLADDELPSQVAGETGDRALNVGDSGP